MKIHQKLCIVLVFLLFQGVCMAQQNHQQEMVEWLSHPMEFSEAPTQIEEIHREITSWPLHGEKVELVFHRYQMANGFTSIGMTGPITWSFIGDDLKGFDMDELKRLYAGWYISFMIVNDSNYSREKNREQRGALETRLKQENQNFVQILDYISIGDLVFYAYKEQQGDKEINIATDTENVSKYEKDSEYLKLPPMYHFLGSLFFSGKL